MAGRGGAAFPEQLSAHLHLKEPLSSSSIVLPLSRRCSCNIPARKAAWAALVLMVGAAVSGLALVPYNIYGVLQGGL